MYPSASRVSRWPLALMCAAVAACTDDPAAARIVAPETLPSPNAAVGDVIMVTTTSGGTDVGSLRWAASQATEGEIIRFDPAIAGKTIVVDSTVKITAGVTIEGPQDKGIVISGGNRVGVLQIATSDSTTLRNLTITGGSMPQASGSAINVMNLGGSSGPVSLEHSTVTGNAAEGPVISANALSVVNSTITNNTTGAIYRTITTTTKLDLINSTLTNNTSGGIATYGPVLLKNSIVANNGTGVNCEGRSGTPKFELAGGNLVDDTTCGDSTKVIIAKPELDSLKNNGGPTKTRRPRPGSPVLDAGKGCDVAVDQRYVPRDTTCDLGAVENADFNSLNLTIDDGLTVQPATGATTVTGTAKCLRPGRFDVAVQLQQTQKVGRTPVVVQAEGVVAVDCGPTVKVWGITLAAAGGAFTNGPATATATPPTIDWLVTSPVTKQVKLFWGHK